MQLEELNQGYCHHCREEVSFHSFIEEASLQLTDETIITYPRVTGYCDICNAVVANEFLQMLNNELYQQEFEKLDI